MVRSRLFQIPVVVWFFASAGILFLPVAAPHVIDSTLYLSIYVVMMCPSVPLVLSLGEEPYVFFFSGPALLANSLLFGSVVYVVTSYISRRRSG